MLDFLRDRIWDADVAHLPRWQAFAYRQLRVGVLFVKGFTAGRIQLRAAAMTFTTLLSFGPVLVIALSILRAFGALPGLQDRLETFLIDNLSAGSQEQVRAWLYTFFESARSGAFRGLSILVLVGGMLGLLNAIESAFNDIWGVHRGRSLFQRFSTYTTLVVFGPILIGLSLSATASVRTWAVHTWIASLTPVIRQLCLVGFRLVPPVLTGLALTLLYTIMPNVRVRLRASLPAGLVAGVLWDISKSGYGAYMRHASQYGTLYGSLAAIPLFLMWVFVSWIVVLFGARSRSRATRPRTSGSKRGRFAPACGSGFGWPCISLWRRPAATTTKARLPISSTSPIVCDCPSVSCARWPKRWWTAASCTS